MKTPLKSKEIYNQADKLADELADRPYSGGKKETSKIMRKISFEIDEIQYEELEDIAIKNKRAKLPLKTISDLLRLAVNDFLIKHNRS
ncbi:MULTISPECIES: hypothetical protein [unclassified Gilliamella]|uniref:hypothetical protein n=1 Tax=unclassified Gilliamella TaxID=2685620 RepID=UPI00226A8CBF|nr:MULTISPECIES: hypothetical protein [unclassified Gilliamella]MCX8589131.1 hypothetical protein [Gilliamella sp. B3801]MCX8592598.1 hypothetical protein [Gilliamella sp. B3804]